jgi:hypothetical protein
MSSNKVKIFWPTIYVGRMLGAHAIIYIYIYIYIYLGCCIIFWSKLYHQNVECTADKNYTLTILDTCLITIIPYGCWIFTSWDLCKFIQQGGKSRVRDSPETIFSKRTWPIDLTWGTEESPLDDSWSRHFTNYNISL